MHKQVAGLVRGQRFDRQRDSTREVIADLVQEVRQAAPVQLANVVARVDDARTVVNGER
ncbi:hypothetical protein ACFZAV_20250 [Streptomyces sp. NPDC008343]|uniref:hypothetical protein n=1 Tax=Streptomyces sp. NPDC008343 TaxID=3364828 RepID=UPI0036E1EB5A